MEAERSLGKALSGGLRARDLGAAGGERSSDWFVVSEISEWTAIGSA